MTVKLLLGIMRKFTPEGKELVLDLMKQARKSLKGEGMALKDFPLFAQHLGKSGQIEKQLLDKSNSLQSIADDAYKSIKTVGIKRKPGTILNKKTGLQEPIDIDRCSVDMTNLEQNGGYHLSACNIEGETIGLVQLERDPMFFVRKPDKQALHIRYFATNPDYKGVGTEMLRQIINISRQVGYGGRVTLHASTGGIPREFARICKGEINTSCAIKYRKMGFISSESAEITANIDEAIKNGKTGLEKSSKRLEGEMHLPDNVIATYFNIKALA